MNPKGLTDRMDRRKNDRLADVKDKVEGWQLAGEIPGVEGDYMMRCTVGGWYG